MDITKLVPKESSFELSAIKRKFHLRPINLSDEIWLKQEFGDSRIQEIFSNIEIEEISRIVFRLIKDEDKIFFKKREVTYVLEDGGEETVEIGGLALFRTMIHGWPEKIALLNALLDNLGISRPEVKEQKEVKKKVTKKKKKK